MAHYQCMAILDISRTRDMRSYVKRRQLRTHCEDDWRACVGAGDTDFGFFGELHHD